MKTPVEQAIEALEDAHERMKEQSSYMATLDMRGVGPNTNFGGMQSDMERGYKKCAAALASLKSVDPRLTFDREGVKKAAREWILAHDGPESEDDAEHILEDLVQRLTLAAENALLVERLKEAKQLLEWVREYGEGQKDIGMGFPDFLLSRIGPFLTTL